MKKIDKAFYSITFMLLILYAIYFLITSNGLPCFIHEFTGLYCPGCGITRMFISLFKMEFYQAFRYNPLIFILLIIAIIFIIFDLIYHRKNKRHIKISNKIYIALLVIVITFGIMRNIPLFSYLAPTLVN